MTKKILFCSLCLLAFSSISFAKEDVKAFTRKIASADTLDQLGVADRLKDLEKMALNGLQIHEAISKNPRAMERVYSKQALCYQLAMGISSVRTLATIGDPSLKDRLEAARTSHIELVQNYGCQ